MFQVTNATEVAEILERYDCLGFNHPMDAMKAILTHEDWANRWDFTETTCEELEEIEKWKNDVLGVLN